MERTYLLWMSILQALTIVLCSGSETAIRQAGQPTSSSTTGTITTEDDSSSSLSTSFIVALVVLLSASAILLILIGLLFSVLIKRKRSHQRKRREEKDDETASQLKTMLTQKSIEKRKQRDSQHPTIPEEKIIEKEERKVDLSDRPGIRTSLNTGSLKGSLRMNEKTSSKRTFATTMSQEEYNLALKNTKSDAPREPGAPSQTRNEPENGIRTVVGSLRDQETRRMKPRTNSRLSISSSSESEGEENAKDSKASAGSRSRSGSNSSGLNVSDVSDGSESEQDK